MLQCTRQSNKKKPNVRKFKQQISTIHQLSVGSNMRSITAVLTEGILTNT